MKKMMALLLAAMMLLGMIGTALAYDEEITWQGIPWGSSVDDVKSLLIEKGFVNDETEIKLDNGYNQIFPMDANGGEIGFETIDSTMPYAVTISLDQPNITVSGYEVMRICFIFAKTGEDSQLITIGIAFSEKGIYKELQKKFASAYGKGKTKKGVFGTEFTTVIGDNNTAVSLLKASISFNETLLYGKLDGIELLQSNLSAPPEQQPKKDAGL